MKVIILKIKGKYNTYNTKVNVKDTNLRKASTTIYGLNFYVDEFNVHTLYNMHHSYGNIAKKSLIKSIEYESFKNFPIKDNCRFKKKSLNIPVNDRPIIKAINTLKIMNKFKKARKANWENV
jgi:hypothetical protein